MAVDKPQSTPEEISAAFGAALDEIEVFGNKVLVATYMAPGVTAGGIILPDQTKDEDRWQGKVGLVVKVGPNAFVSDARTDFKDVTVTVGDWVFFRVSDAPAIDINKVHCRIVEDIFITGRVSRPDLIW